MTFSTNRTIPRFEAGKRSPLPPAYENLLSDVGSGYYNCGPHGAEDEDGNTTTSGSYTLDAADIDDSLS